MPFGTDEQSTYETSIPTQHVRHYIDKVWTKYKIPNRLPRPFKAPCKANSGYFPPLPMKQSEVLRQFYISGHLEAKCLERRDILRTKRKICVLLHNLRLRLLCAQHTLGE